MHNITNTQFFDFGGDSGNETKCEKHGVRRDEVEHLFLSSPDVFPDLKHSSRLEKRFIAVGRNTNKRYLLVAFTFREKGNRECIRPISARYMRKKEVDYYERKKENSDLPVR